MTEAQQIVTMVFGAAVAVAGMVLMLFGRSESSRNHVKVFGMEFELSTPALAVFLVGSGLFVLPHFLPRIGTLEPRSLPPIGGEGSPTTDHLAEEAAAPGKRATRIPEIVAATKRLDNRGGLLTLEMELVNESTVPPRSRRVIGLHNAQVIDERSKTSWMARLSGGEFFSDNLGGGQRTTVWAKFDLGPRAMAKKHAEEAGDPGDRLWLARQDAKIAQAERQAAHLTGEAQIQVRRRIAALKRARTLGPAGLRAAAAKAIGTRAG